MSEEDRRGYDPLIIILETGLRRHFGVPSLARQEQAARGGDSLQAGALMGWKVGGVRDEPRWLWDARRFATRHSCLSPEGWLTKNRRRASLPLVLEEGLVETM